VAYYSGGNAHFEHQDWLGTERVRTTYNGSVEGSFISLPFGDGQSTSGTDGDAIHYAEVDHDNESDSDHAQFRQYSNEQGRWHSPDPYSGSYDFSNPQSINRYTYVANNPLSMLDPQGQQLFAPWMCGVGGDSQCGGGNGYPSPISGDNEFDLEQVAVVVGDFGYWYGSWPMGSQSGPGYNADLFMTSFQWGTLTFGSADITDLFGGPATTGGPPVSPGRTPAAPSNPAPNNNNRNQPPTKIEKQMCSDAANQFVANYNQQNQNLRQSVVVGGGAGAVSSTGGALTGIYYGLRYNWAVSNSLYTMAYRSCMGTSNTPWSSFTNY
jgi:RHS repeat-associated protein